LALLGSGRWRELHEQVPALRESPLEAQADVLSGAVELELSAVQRLDAETVSGRLGVRSAGLQAGGRISLQTVSGAIALALPARSRASELRPRQQPGHAAGQR